MSATTLEELLARNRNSGLLRIATAGSVDDGKSTLIGRLLHDSNAILEDQLDRLHQDSLRLNRDQTDLALLTDGLEAERSQGITIDVAYRYFATDRRRFIIADTPGHEQYTRNMVTGASTADLVMVLVDAQRGLTTQSRRHAFIASLLQTPHVLVVVNKMDLVGWSAERFDELRAEYEDFSRKLEIIDLRFLPVSALHGDNVVTPSANMDWYEGPTLLNQLESVYSGGGRNFIDLRLPIQLVNRPHSGFRGYCGTVASGVVRPGDRIVVLPSGLRSRVQAILSAGEEVGAAGPQQPVTVVLEDDLDVSRGDMIVHVGNQPRVEREAEAMLVWMDESPLEVGREYLLRHTCTTTRCTVTDLRFRIDPEDLHRRSPEGLQLNQIGRVHLQTRNALMIEPYLRNRATGSFVLVDPQTHRTVGAGMIRRPGRPVDAVADRDPATERHLVRQSGLVGSEERSRLLGGQRAATLWFTGRPGAGKSTLAFALERALVDLGHAACVLDGDNIRHGLNRDLGFGPAERSENIRRIAEVARLMNDAGLIVICAFVAPARDDRHRARKIVGDGFLEVYVDTPPEVCERRDPKGQYAKARRGEIRGFTGVDAPYDEPTAPDLRLRTEEEPVEDAVRRLVEELVRRRIVPGSGH